MPHSIHTEPLWSSCRTWGSRRANVNAELMLPTESRMESPFSDPGVSSVLPGSVKLWQVNLIDCRQVKSQVLHSSGQHGALRVHLARWSQSRAGAWAGNRGQVGAGRREGQREPEGRLGAWRRWRIPQRWEWVLISVHCHPLHGVGIRSQLISLYVVADGGGRNPPCIQVTLADCYKNEPAVDFVYWSVRLFLHSRLRPISSKAYDCKLKNLRIQLFKNSPNKHTFSHLLWTPQETSSAICSLWIQALCTVARWSSLTHGLPNLLGDITRETSSLSSLSSRSSLDLPPLCPLDGGPLEFGPLEGLMSWGNPLTPHQCKPNKHPNKSCACYCHLQ